MLEGKVIVIVPVTAVKHKERGVFAVRMRDLGLTAYGHTHNEAWAQLASLFNRFINEHRRREQLARKLNQSGLTWYWEDEYPANERPVIDTTKMWDAIPAIPAITQRGPARVEAAA